MDDKTVNALLKANLYQGASQGILEALDILGLTGGQDAKTEMVRTEDGILTSGDSEAQEG